MTEILSPRLALYLAFLVARVTSCVRRPSPFLLDCLLTVAKIVKLGKSVRFIYPHLIIWNYGWVYWEGPTLAAPLTTENESLETENEDLSLRSCLGGLAGGSCLLGSLYRTCFHTRLKVQSTWCLDSTCAAFGQFICTPMKCFNDTHEMLCLEAWFLCRGAVLTNVKKTWTLFDICWYH